MKKLLCLLAAGLALAALAYWLNRSATARADEGAFQLAAAEFGPLSETVSATGVLQPEEVVVVGSGLPGRVVEINADFNQVVREGDVLLRLDPREAERDLRQAEVGVELARAAVKQAEAQRDAARRALERQRRLPDSVGHKLELDAAEEQLKAAEAGVEAAEAQVHKADESRRRAELGLRLTTVRVPAVDRPAGPAAPGKVRDLDEAPAVASVTDLAPRPKRQFLVLERKAELNQQVGPPASAHLFTLAGDLARMRIRAQVAEGDVSKVRRGQEVDFTVSTYADEDLHFRGRVAEVHLQPAQVRGAIYYEALIDADNEKDPATGEWRLRPGMTASVDIVRRRKADAWKVPAAALAVQIDGPLLTEAARAKLARWQGVSGHEHWKPVWVLDDGKKPWPVFVRVAGAGGEAGLRDGQSVEVLEWDPEVRDRIDPRHPATFPRVLTGVPPPDKGGLFKSPPIRF